MASKRHDWITLEARWIAGEWPTLVAMSKATGVTVRMLQKRSFEHKWTEKKEAVASEATERARKNAVKGLADKLIDANERALKSAKLVLNLGLRHFLDASGKQLKNAITSEATALHAIKTAIQIEQAILRRQTLGGEDPGDGPIISTSQVPETGMEELTDAELDRIIADADRALAESKGSVSTAARSGKSSGHGEKKKTRRKK